MKHLAAEDRSIELKVKYDGLQELITTLKDGQGAKKVSILKKMSTVTKMNGERWQSFSFNDHSFLCINVNQIGAFNHPSLRRGSCFL